MHHGAAEVICSTSLRGLAPQLVAEIFEIVGTSSDEGVSFFGGRTRQWRLRYAALRYTWRTARGVDGSGDELCRDEDVKEFYIGSLAQGRRTIANEAYRRRKRWSDGSLLL